VAAAPSSIPQWGLTPRVRSDVSRDDVLAGFPPILRQLVSFAREPMALASTHGVIVQANEAFRTLVAVPEGEPVGSLANVGDRAGAEVRLAFTGVDGSVLPGVALVQEEGILVLVYRGEARSSDDVEGRVASLPDVSALRSLVGAWDGVVDRRGIEKVVDEVGASASAAAESIGLLVLDIDRFNQVNARFGRRAGDRVLEAFVATVAECLRADDQFGRYGSEDFVAILPKCDDTQAMVVAERIRTAVEKLRVPWEDGEIDVTVSIGIASGVPRGAMADMIKRADRGTYLAKRGGRNRSVVAPD